jgi:Ca2+-binding RTX toxin-like protein
MKRSLSVLTIVLFVAVGIPTAAAQVPTCFGQAATIVGTGGHDRLIGTSGDDVIVGRGWGDSIQGLEGNDLICGGRGNDDLIGGPGHDRVAGGNGADTFDLLRLWMGSDADDGNDRIIGGLQDDAFFGSDGDDTTDGGGGRDTVIYYQDDAPGPVVVNLETGTASGWGDDTLENVEDVLGTSFGDVLVGDGGRNVLAGAPIGQNDGSDTIIGKGGNDQLSDAIFGDDRLNGGPGDDLIEVGPGDDEVSGGLGTDTLAYPYIVNGVVNAIDADLAAGISTGQGVDSLAGIENLIGTSENDTLRGDAASNVLSGRFGQDVVAGRAGDDSLDVMDGEANDSANGGVGTDVCAVDPGDIVTNCES